MAQKPDKEYDRILNRFLLSYAGFVLMLSALYAGFKLFF